LTNGHPRTFLEWIELQLDREDEVGKASRFWRSYLALPDSLKGTMKTSPAIWDKAEAAYARECHPPETTCSCACPSCAKWRLSVK